MADPLDLAKARGVYPDREIALEAARHVKRGFVVSETESKHVVYEGAWEPQHNGYLTVDVERDDGEQWRVVVAVQEELLISTGVIALTDRDVRWLSMLALPAALALIDRLEDTHERRIAGLRWGSR
jgi:hypothetical protein